MQVYRRQDSPSLQEFKVKVRNQEAAVGHQIRKYKINYLSKFIASSQLEPFLIFTKELSKLITSHCKNIIMVSPQSLYSVFQEIDHLIGDLLNKYHDLSLKFNTNMIQLNQKNDTKTESLSELCSICGQSRKKTQIQIIRNQLLQISDFKVDKTNDLGSQNKQEQDLLFFSEVNVLIFVRQNLLTTQQGNIIRNQMEINKYQEIVLQSLNGLIAAQKELIERDKLTEPNRKWIDSAKEQMRQTLKESFSDKIPPWITKMLHYFLQIQLKIKISKEKQVSIQTQGSTMSQIYELKKRVLMSRTKIEQYQSYKKQTQRQIQIIGTEKKALQQKINYYQNQINKLLSEIDTLKIDNQVIRTKLHHSRIKKIQDDHRNSEIEIEREGSKQSMRDTFKTNKSLKRKHKDSISERKILPKIDETTNKTKEARTSIRLESHQTSRFQRSQRIKKTIKMLQDSQRGSETNTLHEELGPVSIKQGDTSVSRQINNNRKSKESRNSRMSIDSKERKSIFQPKQKQEHHGQDPVVGIHKQKQSKHQKEHFGLGTDCQSIIKEEDDLEEEKKKIQKVDEQLRETIKKTVLQKNGHKHFFSSTLPLLKKVPSNTVRREHPSQIQTRESGETPTIPQEDNVLGLNLQKIYSELTKSGYLVKISEEQFKSIIKIKTFEGQQQLMPFPRLQDSQRKSLGKNNRQDRLTVSRRQWNESNFSPQRNMTMRPTVSSFQQSQKDYLLLFTNQRNAFNYQSSLTKNHSRGVYKMSPLQLKYSKELYQKLSDIKHNNNEQYKYICSFLRFPFQMMQNNFEVNFLNDMKYSSFEYYLQRIMGIHSKCKKQNGLCKHMTLFKTKMFDS